MSVYKANNVSPSLEKLHVIMAYKNFAANAGISHIGLGVSAMTTANVLKQNNIESQVVPILNGDDLEKAISAGKALSRNSNSLPPTPISHAIISAPWIPAHEIAKLVLAHPDVDFAVVTHSNVGFLQADPNAISKLLGCQEIQHGAHNFDLAANTTRMVKAWQGMEPCQMVYLPNLYSFESSAIRARRWSPGQTLRIGCFGAMRPLKNPLTAAAAAIQIANRLQVPLEYWVSGKRSEGGGHVAFRAIQELFSGRVNAKLVVNDWQSWAAFRKTVGSMHLLLQPSYTESFNMVTADGVAMGVPSVVSSAIDWTPERWVADADDATDIANVGISLLHDPHAVDEGVKALVQHNSLGLQAWKNYLLRSKN